MSYARCSALLAMVTLFGVIFLLSGAWAQGSSRCDVSPVLERLKANRKAYLDALREQASLQGPIEAPPSSSNLIVLPALQNPLVHDELLYHVAADRNTGAVYVIRSGGYAGMWVVMGPVAVISERPLCPSFPPVSQGD